MKNKTVAAWLAFVGGPLGLHRFYLHGLGDMWAWAAADPFGSGPVRHPAGSRPTGQDDQALSWVLDAPSWGLPWLHAHCTAIIYGLMTPEKWNAALQPQAPVRLTQLGRTNVG
jgi:hypothetical protein